MFMRILAFLLIAALPLMARAADIPTWKIDTAKSNLIFSGTQQGAGFEGKFTDFSGTIKFDPDKPAGAGGTVTVTMSSATTNSPDRDQYLGQDAWFAADKFPTATYAITGIEKIANNQFVAHGNLTIRDKTMPLNLPFTFSLDIGTGATIAHAIGEARLNRLDFGVGQGEWTDTSMIGNEIVVKVIVTAVKQ
jgi:polyisoprenoid-binding protein YceI